MAITASFSAGILTIHGDSLGNSVVISRDKAGAILINGGAVAISGGPATVANTASIQAFGLGDDDALQVDNARGALPPVRLFGGSENDTLSGGTGGEWLFGQDGDDLLTAGAGDDLLFGGAGNDTLVGGTGGDQVFGESGDDLMVWNPGDGTDLFEGGAGVDTAQVSGSNGSEVFTVTANGTRVRFDRLEPEPSSLDIGTTESFVLNAGGGNDVFSATGNLAALITITVDGGAGNDTLLGSNGSDTLIGGTGNDLIDGQQGNDVAFLGSGNDVFQWDPGDGSDVVDGGAGTDTLLFNGSAGNETFDVTANGTGVLFSRSLGNITMDLTGIEVIRVNALGGTDSVVVNDLAGTGVSLVAVDLAGSLGGSAGDGQLDSVTVNGTNAADNIKVALSNGLAAVTGSGIAAKVTVDHAEIGDRLIVNGGGGNDSLTGASLPGGLLTLQLEGGSGNDTLIGSAGGDALLGQDDDDLLLAGAGNDTLFGGAGNDTLVGGTGSNVFVYDSILDAGDLIEGFDATGADSIDLDGLLDGLGIADGERAGRVSVQQAGSGEDALVSVDTNGDQTFDTVIATVTNVTGNLDQNDLNLGTLV